MPPTLWSKPSEKPDGWDLGPFYHFLDALPEAIASSMHRPIVEDTLWSRSTGTAQWLVSNGAPALPPPVNECIYRRLPVSELRAKDHTRVLTRPAPRASGAGR